jgi:hypothetical protein
MEATMNWRRAEFKGSDGEIVMSFNEWHLHDSRGRMLACLSLNKAGPLDGQWYWGVVAPREWGLLGMGFARTEREAREHCERILLPHLKAEQRN